MNVNHHAVEALKEALRGAEHHMSSTKVRMEHAEATLKYQQQQFHECVLRVNGLRAALGPTVPPSGGELPFPLHAPAGAIKRNDDIVQYLPDPSHTVKAFERTGGQFSVQATRVSSWTLPQIRDGFGAALRSIRDQLDLALYSEPEFDASRTIAELIAAARRRVDLYTEARQACIGQRRVIDSIEAVMSRAGIELGTHRDDQLADLLQQALAREPVAYGIFAMIPDEGWVLQFPNYPERADAERMCSVFAAGTELEVRPLYA